MGREPTQVLEARQAQKQIVPDEGFLQRLFAAQRRKAVAQRVCVVAMEGGISILKEIPWILPESTVGTSQALRLETKESASAKYENKDETSSV